MDYTWHCDLHVGYYSECIYSTFYCGAFYFLQVDQWLDSCWNDFEVPVQAMAAACGNQGVIGEAKRHSLAFLAAANACLEKRYWRPFLFHLFFSACCLACAKLQFRAFGVFFYY